MNRLQNKKIKINTDVAAAVMFLLLAVYFFLTVSRGIESVDEAFYFTIPHRFLQGDRPFLDEWHLSQLSGFLQYIPFKLYYMITGSTEGIILYFRYLFIATQFGLYWYVYKKFRNYGLWAVLTASVFLVFEPFGYYTLSYYTMGIASAAVVCCVLFMNEHNTPFSYIFAGIVFACGVLAQPYTVIMYLIFMILCIVNGTGKRKSGSLSAFFNIKALVFVSVGAVAVFVVFCTVLLAKSDISSLAAVVPDLLSDAEYELDFRIENYFEYTRLLGAIECVGYVQSAFALVLLAVIIICRKKTEKKRLLFFVLSCISFVICIISLYAAAEAHAYFSLIIMHPFPLCVFGLQCYFLMKERDKKLGCFLIYSAIFSFIAFCQSDVAVGVGASVAGIPAIIVFGKLFGEFMQDNSDKAGKKNGDAHKKVNISRICISAALCCIIGFNIMYLGFTVQWKISERFYSNSDEKIDTVIQSGALKGLVTVDTTAVQYEKALRDLDEIKKSTQGAVYIANACPSFYMYLDLPYSTYAAYYVPVDSEVRQERWWELHPEKLPEYVYIPKFNCESYTDYEEAAAEKLEYIQSIFECISVKNGEAGYIVRTGEYKKE